MFSKFELALKYTYYYCTASNGRGHGIHSPFVFDFVAKILNDKNHYPSYDVIEELRGKLLKDETVLTVEDFGAGSVMDKANQRSVSSIAKHAVKSKKYGQLFFRMAKAYKPQTILELGTSLGITTAYLISADPAAKVITLEGAKAVAEKAKENFAILNLSDIQLIEGNFDQTLSSVIFQLSSVDLAFIDGNHRKEPTIEYFTSILSKINNFSIVILDDIHWSREMEEVWEYCKNHSSVTLSINLFFMGILFFRKEIREKQHFSIRF
ncbi:MAG TPA: class I SAM-dependent methyltransferase [Chitinophagaceae bacterium]|nr:class I SAM-dependent methyltransferase [Chitinophagaceae bacterium]